MSILFKLEIPLFLYLVNLSSLFVNRPTVKRVIKAFDDILILYIPFQKFSLLDYAIPNEKLRLLKI